MGGRIRYAIGKCDRGKEEGRVRKSGKLSQHRDMAGLGGARNKRMRDGRRWYRGRGYQEGYRSLGISNNLE